MSLDVYLNTPVCECCGRSDQVHWSNITHNLGAMAKEAGIYYHLWRPDELGINVAFELIEPLLFGLQRLNQEPEKYMKHDSENGWGTYKDFVPWVEEYLNACIKNPDAEIEVSR